MRQRGPWVLGAIVAVALAQVSVTEQASGSTAVAAGARMTIATKTFRLTRANETPRLVVRCPGRTTPFGGGMMSNPPPSADGEAVYPHSFERLGVQQGWHVTPVLFDPSHGSTQPRSVTLQVVCGRRHRHVTPPHTSVRLGPGQTKTIRASCPGRRHLFGGGFQRTDFISAGGTYVSESRAIDARTWQVTGHAFGVMGGQLTAIAYCRRSKNPLLTEVSGSTTLSQGQYASATTPPCPPGRRLVFGGFATSPPGAVLISEGYINGGAGWTGSGFNYFGPAATLSEYGYCAAG
jgi:hypothetical protein